MRLLNTRKVLGGHRVRRLLTPVKNNYMSLIKNNRCTSCGIEISEEEAKASGHNHLDD